MSLLRLLKRNVYQADIDLADRFSDTPEPTFWSKWFGGLIVPILLVGYGLRCCMRQSALFHGTADADLELQGRTAVVFGLAWVSAGLFAHFHYFWSTLKGFGIFTDIGKALSLIALIAAVGFVAWSVVMR